MLIYLQMIEDDADRSKFEQLYTKYRKLMLYVANQMLHNPDDAEDAVHEAFLAIAKNIKKIRTSDCLQTRNLVVIITERKSIDLIKKRSSWQSFEENENIVGVMPQMPADSGLAQAISELPAKAREILLLRYIDGYSTREIAEMLDMNLKAVQKSLERTRALLRKKLDGGDTIK